MNVKYKQGETALSEKEKRGECAMRVMVLDSETTGISDTDQVVEIAYAMIEDGAIMGTWSTLIKPTVPITVEAKAIHHIVEKHLVMAPLATEISLPQADIIAGHSIDFDCKMLAQSGVQNIPEKRICTWRCSRHVFPDAPSHSNSVLRYWLDLEIPHCDLPPHRALPDVIVTAALLERLLRHHSVDRLVELTEEPVLLTTVRFGKHRGKRWDEVDTDYLRWVTGTPDFEPDVLHTARHILAERERRVKEKLEEQKLVEQKS